jgi:hypothetical protein
MRREGENDKGRRGEGYCSGEEWREAGRVL